MTVRIEAPYFCAGITILNGRGAKAAPIIAYMVGWTLFRIERYCQVKGWGYELVP